MAKKSKDTSTKSKSKVKSKKSSKIKASSSKVRRLVPRKSKKSDDGKGSKVGYLRASYRELKKVTWPNRKEAWRLTFAVLIFSAVFALIIALADYAFKNLVERIFL